MQRIFKLIVLLFLPLSAVAQNQPLTLEQCRELAIENSYNLKSSLEKIAASQDMLKSYKANNFPKFSLAGGYLYSTTSMREAYLPNILPNWCFEVGVGSLYGVSLQAMQPIYMGGKVSTATKLAKVGIEAAKAEETRTKSDVVVTADEAFFTYLNVEEMKESAYAYRAVVDECYRQVENVLKSGMCTKNDLLKVQVKVNEAELLQMKADNGLRLARMNLCYVTGLPMDTTELEIVDNIDDNHFVEDGLDVSNRPEYSLLEKNIEAKELEVKLAQSDFLPSISAIVSYNYASGFTFNDDVLLDPDPALTAGVMVNVPIFHWGEGRRKVSAKRHEVEIAKNTQADLVQKMTLELMQSINMYKEAVAQVTLMERSMEQANENLRQSGKLYTSGMETLSNYLEAQALWQKAMSDLVEAKSAKRLAYVRYCRARGAEM